MCDTLFPNEFTFEEKLVWYNELGGMLCRDHLVSFEEATINPNKDGTYTLPEGITLLDVDRIIADGRVLRKKDARWCGITYISAPKGTEGTPISFKKKPNGAIKVIYQKKYEPVRKVEAEFDATISGNTFTVKNCNLKEGDKIDAITENKDYIGTVKSVEIIDDETAVFTVDFTFDERDEEEDYLYIYRHLTDTTLLDEPFDTLYIDFINAKICFYQRDYENYNAHMTVFNSRLADLDLYLAKALPSSPDTVLKNWF